MKDVLKQEEKRKQKVLFLTNNDNALPLYEWIRERAEAELCREPLRLEAVREISPSIIISYNYNYIIGQDIIDFMQGNILNMHISYLPWNRGFSPNVWSFLEDTPKGVTIHKIDRNLDKGKILFQERLEMDPAQETLETSYNRLNEAISELFKRHWNDIMDRNYEETDPQGKGSYHSKADLDALQAEIPFSWSDRVIDVISAYRERMSEKK